MISKLDDSAEHVADICIVGGGPAGLALAAICERKGLDYIVYERSSVDTPPRGGCLDLHPGSGQRAMKAAGVFDTFKKLSRGGDSSQHCVYDHKGNYVYTWGAGRDSPEIDRFDIKKCYLTAINPENVRWRKTLESSSRDDGGEIVLRFTDGSTAKGFKLVVGADGVFSKVRHLVTPVEPRYYGVVFYTGVLRKDNPMWQGCWEKAGEGPMVILGRNTKIWLQIQGSGDFRCDFGFFRPADFAKNGPVHIEDTEGVKEQLLGDDFFGHHDEFFKDLIRNTPEFRDWPLYEMPPEALNWSASSDVTLIGDAAHATTPFIGEGANSAMRDTVILTDRILEMGFGRDAIAAYEQEMFEINASIIQQSAFSGQLFFEWDSPTGFVREMKKFEFIGAIDNQ